MRSYLIPFLVALGLHAALLCSFCTVMQQPENGLAAGLSSLEVTLLPGNQGGERTSLLEEKKLVSEGRALIPKKSTKMPSPPGHEERGLDKKGALASAASSGATGVIPSYLHNPQPLYPEGERRAGHEGTALLRVGIDVEGVITDLRLEHSSGYPLLDQQALTTVGKSWVFRPASQNGHPVASRVLIPIHFSLKD